MQDLEPQPEEPENQPQDDTQELSENGEHEQGIEQDMEPNGREPAQQYPELNGPELDEQLQENEDIAHEDPTLVNNGQPPIIEELLPEDEITSPELEGFPPEQEVYPPEIEELPPEHEIHPPENDDLSPELEELYPDLQEPPDTLIPDLDLDLDLDPENITQYRPWEQITEENLSASHPIFAVFTSAIAFDAARRMFIANHGAAEIESAFALGAALQVEPHTFLLQPGVYRRASEATFADNVSTEAVAARPAAVENMVFATEQIIIDVATTNQSEARLNGRNDRIDSFATRDTIDNISDPVVRHYHIFEPAPNNNNIASIATQNRHPAMLHPFDAEIIMYNINASSNELDEILTFGQIIMNLGENRQQAQNFMPLNQPFTPLVVNPFNINISASESVSLNTGAASYRTHILSLPGRGGFGFNLDLIYSSARADYDALILWGGPFGMDAQYPMNNESELDTLAAYDFDLDYSSSGLSYVTVYNANLYETNWFYVNGRLIGSFTVAQGSMSWESSAYADAYLYEFARYSWDVATIDSQQVQVLTQRWADTWQDKQLVQASDITAAYIPIEPMFNSKLPRRNLHGLGAGWIFDLPYIIDHMLYIPGRGSFAVRRAPGYTHYIIVGHSLYDMHLEAYNGFYSGYGGQPGLWSTRRLTFHNGTRYYFHNQHIIGMRDRHGNTIRFHYAFFSHNLTRLLTQIIDSSGQYIGFEYRNYDTERHSVTVNAPDATTYTINMRRIEGDFVLESIRNQVGAVTTFNYRVAPFSLRFDNYWGREYSHTALLYWVNYPSGARLSFSYTATMINMAITGYREIFRLTSRALVGGGRDYLRTNFSYVGDHTGYSYSRYIDRPPSWYTYTVTVYTNNGLYTIYTFNYRHLNIEQRIISPGAETLSIKTIAYSDGRQPTDIRLREFRYDQSRETRYIFEYNRYGQVTMALSPMARGNRNQVQYQTRFQYDSRFGIQTRRIFYTDSNTNVTEANVLCANGWNIIRSDIWESGRIVSRTEFTHDRYGNIAAKREFPNTAGSAYISTHFNHSEGFSLPHSVWTANILDAYGDPAIGNGFVQRTFLYDAMGRVITEIDPNGYQTHWQYDGIGRITRITHPDGGFEIFHYDDRANTMQHRTVLGIAYVYRYDQLGNLREIFTNEWYQLLSNVYDNRMRLVETRTGSSVAFRGNRTVFAYDAFDRVIEETVFCMSTLIQSRVITHHFDVYDSAGNSRIVTIQEGNSARNAPTIIPGAPSIVSFALIDPFGRIIQEGTVGGQVFTYNHDIIGRVTNERSLGINNTFTHNIHGITSVRNINGHTARNEYDHLGRLTKSYDFRGFDQRFYYDALGRLIRHYKPMFDHSNGGIYHTVTTYQYDRNNNLTRTATLVNRQYHTREWAETINTFTYNRLTSSQIGGTRSDGILTEYTYDRAGNILTKRLSGQLVASYTYDNRGFLTSSTDASGRAEVFTHDWYGNVATRTDRNGIEFQYEYDGMGRLFQIFARQNGEYVGIVAKQYHITGALWQQINFDMEIFDNSHHIVYEYDAQGRLIRQYEVRQYTFHRVVDTVHTYSYNEANNITHFTTSINGAFHVWEYIDYDVAQRPRVIRTFEGWGGFLARYYYDANSNRTRTVLRNGIITDYSFGPGNMVTHVINWRGNTVLSNFHYIYLLDGNVYQLGEWFQEAERNRTVVYTYDMARRLIREQTTHGHGLGERVFTYDWRGNRQTMTVTGRENYTVMYNHTACNRLIVEARVGDGAHTTNFTYDGNGNQLTRTTGNQVETRTYNAFNQLIRVTRPGMNAVYTYGADGLRNSRTVNGWRTYQVWNHGQLALELNGNRQVINRCYIALVVNHRIRSVHQGFYLYNARGDVIQITNNHGYVLDTYQYDAFGNVLWDFDHYAPYSNNPFLFNGEFFDWETREYYLRARSYNPRLGRFTQPDPHWNIHNMIFGDSPTIRNGRNMPSVHAMMQASNLYAYCINNPIMYADPSGRIIGAVIGAVIGGVVGGVSAAIRGSDIRTGILAGATSGAVIGGVADYLTYKKITAPAALVGGMSLGGSGGGALNSFINQVGNQWQWGTGTVGIGQAARNVDLAEIFISAGIGGAGGALSGLTAVGLNKVHQTAVQLYRSTLAQPAAIVPEQVVGTGQALIRSATNVFFADTALSTVYTVVAEAAAVAIPSPNARVATPSTRPAALQPTFGIAPENRII